MMQLILFSFFSGVTIFFGGILAYAAERHLKKQIETHILHWSVAFGGGILVAAVGFVLVPKGIAEFSMVPMIFIFLAGALSFFWIDRAIEKKGGLLAQTMAMLMDYIPEAMALGAVFAHDHKLGMLLALFIGFQNLPESFNAYFDLRAGHQSAREILMIFFVLSFLGIFATLTGRFVLDQTPRLTAGIMLFAGGGILYLIFQDIAPSSKLRNHWDTALGANFGFLVGMIGTKIFS